MKNLTLLFLLLISVYGYSQDQKKVDFQSRYTELAEDIDSYLINSNLDLTEVEKKNHNDLEESIKKQLFSSAELVESEDDVQMLIALALTFNPEFSRKVKARANRVFNYKRSLK